MSNEQELTSEEAAEVTMSISRQIEEMIRGTVFRGHFEDGRKWTLTLDDYTVEKLGLNLNVNGEEL